MPDPLWVTYAWKDNDEGDFDYFVNALGATQVPAAYDKVQLIPGRTLWAQIGDRIMNGRFSGWAILLTPNSLSSPACKEELEYALTRALQRGNDFPLIGLLHGIPISECPPALQVRLCVDLRSADWVEQVKAGVENRPPSRVPAAAGAMEVTVGHTTNYLNTPAPTAIQKRTLVQLPKHHRDPI
ncbi:MAG: toll/interleukin-1 receptor domain-containing protein [Planctomycetes bacterium]|nr:toll/interleukin-1 receptor domain-containing protein [Planctomycetota bacterium]